MRCRAMKFLTVMILAVGSLIGSVALTAGTAYAADRDCGDFDTQAAAQRFFLDNGGPDRDPHGLDAEGDGVACESNPCPCNYSTGGGGGTPPAEPIKRQKARIIKVVEGDTVRVKLTGGTKARRSASRR